MIKTLSPFREFEVKIKTNLPCVEDKEKQIVEVSVFFNEQRNTNPWDDTELVRFMKLQAKKQYYLEGVKWGGDLNHDPDWFTNSKTFTRRYQYPREMSLKEIEKDLRSQGIEKIKTDLYRITDKWVDETIKTLNLKDLTMQELTEISNRENISKNSQDLFQRKKVSQQKKDEEIKKGVKNVKKSNFSNRKKFQKPQKNNK